MLQSIKGAGHNVHTDQSERFNEIVNSVCESVDENDTSEHNRSW